MAHRFDGLKVMLDGLPLNSLVDEGTGDAIGPFLMRVQDKYAETYGQKNLGDVVGRKDAGKRQHKRRSDGKVTVTTFKRRRKSMLQDGAQLRVSDVFGFRPAGAQERSANAEQELTSKHKELAAKNKQKWDSKMKDASSLVKREVGARRLAQLSPADYRKAKARHLKAKKQRATPRWNLKSTTAAKIVQRLGEVPLFFAAPGFSPEGLGWSGPFYMERPLCRFRFEGGRAEQKKRTPPPHSNILS